MDTIPPTGLIQAISSATGPARPTVLFIILACHTAPLSPIPPCLSGEFKMRWPCFTGQVERFSRFRRPDRCCTWASEDLRVIDDHFDRSVNKRPGYYLSCPFVCHSLPIGQIHRTIGRSVRGPSAQVLRLWRFQARRPLFNIHAAAEGVRLRMNSRVFSTEHVTEVEDILTSLTLTYQLNGVDARDCL